MAEPVTASSSGRVARAPTARPSSDAVDVEVRALASSGAGVADLPDGRVVFVQRTSPGDRARVRVVKSRPRWAEGTLLRLVEAAPDRVDPPCGFYDRCGGCRLQHVPYPLQLEWKGRFVADALQRIGGLSNADVAPVSASPRTYGYRSRVTFTLRRLRGGHVVAGYHALDRPAHVIDVDGPCLLADDALNRTWAALRAGWGEGARLLPSGGRLRLTLRLADAGTELLVEGGEEGWDAGALQRGVPELSAVWHLARDVEGAAELRGGAEGEGGGVAFEQVNREAAALLRAHVLRVVSARYPVPGAAVDAYCGDGVYGRALAAEGWTVTGIEADPAAVPTELPDGFSLVTGLVEDHVARALPADLLVLNPPRAGLDPAVPPRILSDPPQIIVYVSCDPGTLARDVRALAPGYVVDDVAGFDLFPQTAHVETVAVLSRRDESASGPQGETS
jgi:23S rRNA (uracil1939-C5)-methyltransferase